MYAVACAVGLLFLNTRLPHTLAEPVAVSFEEKLLILIPTDQLKPILNKGGYAKNNLITINRTYTQAAYAASKDGKNFVVVGKEKGPDLDGEVSSLMLSDDGLTVVYVVADKSYRRICFVNHKPIGDGTMSVKSVAMRDLIRFDPQSARLAVVMQQGQKDFVIDDGRRGPEFEGNPIYQPVMTPGGKHFAYTVRQPGKYFVVIDGKNGPMCNNVDGPVFSPDGTRVAHSAGGAMMIDGTLGPKFEGAFDPVFTHDGTGLAYRAKEKDKHFVVFNGKPGPLLEKTLVFAENRIVISPDNKRIAYAAQRDGKMVAVIDDAVGEPFDEVFDVRFSPDSRRVLYKAKLGGKEFIVENDKRGEPFDKVMSYSLVFSPDSATLAYWAEVEKKFCLVVNDKKVAEYEVKYPFAPVISPDSTRIAYSVNQPKPAENKGFVVVNDKPGPEFDGVSGPVFSPDGKSMVYAAARGGKQFLVINDKPGPECDTAQGVTFSPDSKKVGYQAIVGRELWWKVLEVGKP